MKHYDLLIIDDEQRYVDMLAKRLTLRDCVSKVGYNGTDGISLIQQYDFHLVVLDLQLPDLYGTEVLKRIKELRPQVPVVILTGHGTEADRKTCMALGALDFIHKPLEIEDLLVMLEKVKKRAV
jgi:DNA-binding response OmpR family regulator